MVLSDVTIATQPDDNGFLSITQGSLKLGTPYNFRQPIGCYLKDKDPEKAAPDEEPLNSTDCGAITTFLDDVIPSMNTTLTALKTARTKCQGSVPEHTPTETGGDP